MKTMRNCSFCCHDETVVAKLIVSNGVAICDRCIATCNVILNEPRERGAKEYDSWQLPQSREGER